MITITKERLLTIQQWRETYGPGSNVVLPAEEAVAFYEQVKRENPPVETGAWKDAVDWVLKQACQAVNTGINERRTIEENDD
ncbi:TPA: hypothetical protein ODK93_002817 [Escherichia coli]|nr:hypothetical protein [Escherichia coli]